MVGKIYTIDTDSIMSKDIEVRYKGIKLDGVISVNIIPGLTMRNLIRKAYDVE